MINIEDKKKIEKIGLMIEKDFILRAKNKGESLVKDSELKAESIVRAANSEAKKILSKNLKKIEEMKSDFFSNIKVVFNNLISKFKSSLEEELFSDSILGLFSKELKSGEFFKDLLKIAFKEDGGRESISLFLSGKSKTELLSIAKLVIKTSNIKNVTTNITNTPIKIKISTKDLTLDIDLKELTEMVITHIRSNIRSILFKDLDSDSIVI